MKTPDKKKIITAKVQLAIESLRPFLKADGGDVELVEIDEQMRVHIRLLGQCRSCTMSAMTLKAGIEDGIRRAVPEIQEVLEVVETEPAI